MRRKNTKDTISAGASCGGQKRTSNGVLNDVRLSDRGGADRINGISFWLKQRFGKKMIKLACDAGFTCPNRDGTLSTGGCTFCGERAGSEFSSRTEPGKIKASLDEQIRMYRTKWPDAGYLAYFQNHTNTYAPVETLRRLYYEALSDPRIEGLAVATRPDCLGDDVLALLKEIGSEHFLWVELGLQTANDGTADRINRCYPLSVYDAAAEKLNALGIRFVTHLILGLPGETKDDMEASVDHVCRAGTWGLKLHMLNIVKGSAMGEEDPVYVPFGSIEEYVDLVCDLLERIPEDVVIHRLTADAERRTLIAPEWSYQKRTILNSIHAELRRRGSYQGSAL